MLDRDPDAAPLRDLDAAYTRLHEIGRGATGAVYLARRHADGRMVAVKLVQGGGADDPESPAVARCAHEARTVSRLDHPNIVQHHELCRTRDGGLALVMEYVAGETLRQVLEQEPCPPYDGVETVLRDLARALAHAHAHGVVHRDVKPENIFIDAERNRALLADFDIAASAVLYYDTPADGAVTGTPRYMPPEQIDGCVADERSDLYSLGMVGWEMLAGQRPWAHGTMDEVLYQQKYEELPPVRTLRPDVPERLALAIEAVIQKSLDFRLASAAEFLEQLSQDVPTGRTAQLRMFVRRPALPVASAIPAADAPVGDAPAVDTAAQTLAFHPGEVDASAVRARALHADFPDATAAATTPTDVVPPRRRRMVGAAAAGVVVLGAAALGGKAWVVESPRPSTTLRVAAGDVALGPSVRWPVAPPLTSPRTDGASTSTPSPGRARRAPAGSAPAAVPPRPAAAPPVVVAPAPRVDTVAVRAAALTRAARALYASAAPPNARPAPRSGALRRARRLLDSAAALQPRSPDIYLLRARVTLGLGDLRRAWSDAETAGRLGRRWHSEALTVLIDAAARDTAAARARAAGLLRSARQRRFQLTDAEGAQLALALAVVGDRAGALEVAGHVRRGSAEFRALLNDPEFAPLRNHPRLTERRSRGRP